MELSGSIRIARPPQDVAEALYNPMTLRALLPPDSQFQARERGSFEFTVFRNVGPVRLNLPVTISLQPKKEAFGQVLAVRAGHFLAGKAALDLVLDLAPLPQGTRLNWSGALKTSGPMGRVATENAQRIPRKLENLIQRLKLRIEADGEPGEPV